MAQSLREVVAQQRPDAVATLMEGWSNTTNPGPDATTLEGLPGTVDVVMIIYEDATGTTECYSAVINPDRTLGAWELMESYVANRFGNYFG